MRKGKIVRAKDVQFIGGYEPPLRHQTGINKDTVDNPCMTIGHVVIPPRGRTQRHYHMNCDAAGYIIKGRVRMFWGPDHDMEEFIGEAGDFFFNPRGVIHGLENLSDTEPLEMMGSYCGVSHNKEAGTIFVEPPWE